jgi:hypothetical protein
MAFRKGQSGNAKGRPKGVPNKLTIEVKQMVIDALHNAGGVEYLELQAKRNPQAFLTLVGKVIPLQANLGGHDGGQLLTRVIHTFTDDAADGQ